MVKKPKTNDGGGNEDIRNEKLMEEGMELEDQAETGSKSGESLDTDDSESPSKGQDDSGDNIISDGEYADEVSLLKEQLQKKEEELKQYVDLAQRVKAEFDNFKKRTAREREQLYTDITGDIISKILPVIDNLERAVSSAAESTDGEKISEGLKLIMNQINDILAKEGVEEIKALNENFDPNYHDAVMHVEDENYGPNTVVEVFQKGYKIKEKVLRYSAVKVAN